MMMTMVVVFSFWPHRTTCEILVPRQGMEPVLSAVEAQGPNHWTAWEVPWDKSVFLGRHCSW